MSQQTVLSVEHDEGIFYIISLVFREIAPSIKLHRSADVEEALDVLRQNQRSGAKQPCLLLLDVNLPKRNGFKLLYEMQWEGLLASIPCPTQKSDQHPK